MDDEPVILGEALLFGACFNTGGEEALDAGSSRLDGRVVAMDGTAGSCAQVAESSPSACSDGCDNDGDSLVDCDDPNCAAVSACDPGPLCPLPVFATRAVRTDPAPTEIEYVVDAAGRLVSVEGEPCEEVEPRPQVIEFFHDPPRRCVATYRCGECLWTFRNESTFIEGPGQNGLLLWSDRATDEVTEPACPAYSGHLYDVDVLGNPYHRGSSDPWRECSARGGVEGPNGACLITDCARCPDDAECRSGGLSYCLPKGECTRDADCPRGWQCQQFTSSSYQCRIPCTVTTTGASAECPGDLGCTDDTAVGRSNHWCVDRFYQQRICDACLDSCRDLPEVTNCCCGTGCICQSECQNCTFF